MPTSADDKALIQVITFDVAAGRQDDLITVLVEQVERWVRFCPGFISSTFHASLDGRHVLNYACWRDEASLDGFTRDRRSDDLSAAVKAIGPESGPHATRYTVAYAVKRAGQDG